MNTLLPKPPFSSGGPEASTGFLIWQMSNLWQGRIRALLEPFDLTHVQFVLLAGLLWLEAHDGEEVSQVRLAHFVKTDVMMTSKVIRTLENKGLLERHIHSADTRAKSLALTARGRELVQEAMPAVESCDARFFRALGDEAGKFNAQLVAIIQSDTVAD